MTDTAMVVTMILSLVVVIIAIAIMVGPAHVDHAERPAWPMED